MQHGDELGRLIAERIDVPAGGVLVISQKIVSKAEGRVRTLADVEISTRAATLAEKLEKDPAVVQLALEESRRIVRAESGVLICETHSGLICANAGIDSSNVAVDGTVLLLPEDPDASARRMRAQLAEACGVETGVVIADSFGRPWRIGQTDVAIGCAGIDPVADWRGREDRAGRELSATLVAVADQLAGAADLARDKAAGVPAVLFRGLEHLVLEDDGPGAVALQRAAAEDLFR